MVSGMDQDGSQDQVIRRVIDPLIAETSPQGIRGPIDQHRRIAERLGDLKESGLEVVEDSTDRDDGPLEMTGQVLGER